MRLFQELRIKPSGGQSSRHVHSNGLCRFRRIEGSVHFPFTTSCVKILPTYLVRSANVASPAIAHVHSCSAKLLQSRGRPPRPPFHSVGPDRTSDAWMFPPRRFLAYLDDASWQVARLIAHVDVQETRARLQNRRKDDVD